MIFTDLKVGDENRENVASIPGGRLYPCANSTLGTDNCIPTLRSIVTAEYNKY